MPSDVSGNAWHFVTCSYPPDIGGLASYSSTVADALRRGGAVVHVWCPGAGDRDDRSIAVHAFNFDPGADEVVADHAACDPTR